MDASDRVANPLTSHPILRHLSSSAISAVKRWPVDQAAPSAVTGTLSSILHLVHKRLSTIDQRSSARASRAPYPWMVDGKESVDVALPRIIITTHTLLFGSGNVAGMKGDHFGHNPRRRTRMSLAALLTQADTLIKTGDAAVERARTAEARESREASANDDSAHRRELAAAREDLKAALDIAPADRSSEPYDAEERYFDDS
jgi:hypothetical protein